MNSSAQWQKPPGYPIDKIMEKTSEQLREEYKPGEVNVLFIGESPPQSGKFFYKEDSILYKYTREVFNLVYKGKYTTEFLEFFKSLGCYLDDLCHYPINNKSDEKRFAFRKQEIPSLATRIKEMQPKAIVIVMQGIEQYVQEAITLSGLHISKDRVFTTNFPRNKSNVEIFKSNVMKFLSVLIEAKIIPAYEQIL